MESQRNSSVREPDNLYTLPQVTELLNEAHRLGYLIHRGNVTALATIEKLDALKYGRTDS